MSRHTYKILVDPNTFESLVQELTVPTCEEEMPLGKRRMTSEEVEAKWTQQQFIDALSEYGYGYAARKHIDEYNLFQNKE